MTNRRRALALGLVLLGALWVRWRGASHDLPFVYDPDEPLFVTTALRMLETRRPDPGWYGGPATTTFYALSATYAAIYGAGRVLHHWSGPDAFRDTYQADPTLFYMNGRLINVAFGVASVFVVYRIGRKLLGDGAGLTAAAFFALCPLHVALSQNARMDAPLVFFMLLAFLFALSIVEGGGERMYLLAGAAAGLAVVSKWPGVVVVAILLMAHLMNSRGSVRLLVRGFLGFLLGSVLIAPWLVYKADRVLEDVRREARTEHLSHTGGGFLGNLGWYVEGPLERALSVSGLVLGAVGLAFCLGSRSKSLRLLAAMPVLYLLFVSALRLRWDRWVLPVVPFVCLLAALAIRELAGRLALRPWLEGASWAGLSAVVILPLGAATWSQGDSLMRPNTITVARDWVLEHVPAGSRIVVERYTPALPFERYRLYYVTDQGELREAERRGATPNFGARGSIGKLRLTDQLAANEIRFAALSSLFDRYSASMSDYPAEAERYERLLGMGRLVYDGGPTGDEARGPRVRILELATP